MPNIPKIPKAQAYNIFLISLKENFKDETDFLLADKRQMFVWAGIPKLLKITS